MSENVHDLLDEIEARTAFIAAAVGAFSAVDAGLLPNQKGWEGFQLVTLDLLILTTRAREMVKT